ncbi:MAG: hypothetical protein N3B01_04905 [Verrucomicrobiae bacterium]|nr:hypothetical protein [Verrucomicrobiae bacterium]
MKQIPPPPSSCSCCRRDFIRAAGMMAGAALLDGISVATAGEAESKPRKKQPAKILGAFLYPPSESLRKAGYWSWPGSTFDAEARQKQYTAKLRELERTLGILLVLEEKPLDEPPSVSRFVAAVKEEKPDGLLLIPFKKSHWQQVVEIVRETRVPTVVFAGLGVLLSEQITELYRKPGVYLISALDDLEAVGYGLRMIRTIRRMKDSRLLCIRGTSTASATVPRLGTEIRFIPHARFVEEYQATKVDDEVRALAESYRKNAKEIVQPTAADIVDAAKTYFALKRLVAAEHADAVMMECLSGLRHPRKHPPPCMGFMSLRDEGVPAGCQADLNATLTLMLVQQLFDKPGFQQNAAMNTERNLFFGAHCTAPSRMRGCSARPEPYVLMSHAEAGWGCVPRVLFTAGHEATIALYLSGEKPQMIIYPGKIVGCPPIPVAGGCRTNIEMTINEVSDVCDVKGMHQIIFYGNHGRHLRAFCQLKDIAVVS